MKFIVREIEKTDYQYPILNGRWYIVEPKSRLIRLLFGLNPFAYSPHRDKKDAIKEAKLKSTGEWYWCRRGVKNATIKEIEV